MNTTPLKRKMLSFTALLLLLVSSPVFSQLAAWNPAGVGGYGPSPWAPTSSSASVTVGGWTRGATVGQSGVAAGSAFGGNAWYGGLTEDITFTITSNPGSIVSYSVFNLFYRRSSTGPATGTFEYTFGNSSTTYTVISPMNFATSTANTGFAHAPINLSTITDLQNVTPGTVVKFRILPTGGQAAGTWYIYGSGASIEGSFSGFGLSIATASAVTCNGASNGAIAANPAGSTGPYTYLWSTGATTSVIAGLSAGIYSCFVTSSISETTSATYTLTQPAAVSATVASQSNVTCNGGANGAATLTPLGGTPAYTYSWLPAGGTNTTVINLAAGTYTLNIKDINNCTGSQTLAITQPAATLTPVASSTVICNGSTVSVNTTGANSYSWTSGVISGMPFSPTVTATYTVSATNPTGGCIESTTLTIVVNPSPTVTIVSGLPSPSTCSGSSITLTGSGATSFTWSDGIIDGIAFTPTATASYTVTGTDANNCSGTAMITITVNPVPTVSITSASPKLCKGKSTTLTASGAATYSWTTPANAGATTLSVSVSPTVTTSYSLTGTDLNGCANSTAISQTVITCVGIETYNSDEAIHVMLYPNPNNGSFTIKHTADINLLVINGLGQTIQSVQLNEANNRELKITDLSSGIYFIQSATNSVNINQKVVVTK